MAWRLLDRAGLEFWFPAHGRLMPTDLPPADAAPHTRARAIFGVDTGAALRGAGGDAGPLRALMIPIADPELP